MESVDIWVIVSRHTNRILDCAATLQVAQERRDTINYEYQTDEYVVVKGATLRIGGQND